MWGAGSLHFPCLSIYLSIYLTLTLTLSPNLGLGGATLQREVADGGGDKDNITNDVCVNVHVSPHSLTPSLSRPLTLSLSHPLTLSLSRFLKPSLSLSLSLSISRRAPYALSSCRRATASSSPPTSAASRDSPRCRSVPRMTLAYFLRS